MLMHLRTFAFPVQFLRARDIMHGALNLENLHYFDGMQFSRWSMPPDPLFSPPVGDRRADYSDTSPTTSELYDLRD